MLFGCRDLASLLLILAVNACMNLFGLLMEVVNQYTTSTDWTPFWFGCAAGVWPWIVALMYFLGGGNYDKIPVREPARELSFKRGRIDGVSATSRHRDAVDAAA